ncbi:MAG TPA: hypothetical protein VMV78_06125 [Thiobacillus sp.]|jgi:hypothetical protein|nr:hypothetical protein [Thiobacillus sp.]
MPANVILSDKGEKVLLKEGAAIDFVHAAFSHLKAIPVNQGGQMLLKKANVEQDAGVLDHRAAIDLIRAGLPPMAQPKPLDKHDTANFVELRPVERRAAIALRANIASHFTAVLHCAYRWHEPAGRLYRPALARRSK